MSIEKLLLVAGLGVAGFLIVYNVLTPHQPPRRRDDDEDD